MSNVNTILTGPNPGRRPVRARAPPRPRPRHQRAARAEGGRVGHHQLHVGREHRTSAVLGAVSGHQAHLRPHERQGSQAGQGAARRPVQHSAGGREGGPAGAGARVHRGDRRLDQDREAAGERKRRSLQARLPHG